MMMKPHIQQLLILKSRGLITATEVAMVIGKSERHVQQVFADVEKDFTAEDIRTISNYLSDRGYNQVAKCFISPEFTVSHVGHAESNGIVDDELADMVVILGDIKTKHKDRCSASMLELITEATKVLNRLQAEAKRL